MKKIRDWFLDWVFPEYCVGCMREGKLFCSCCRRVIKSPDFQVCPVCYRLSCNGFVCNDCEGRWALDGLYVCYDSCELLRKVLYLYKYEGMWALGENIVDMIIKSGFRGGNFDMIAPVPLHRSRYLWRGYNQSQILAKNLARKLDIEYVDMIVRINQNSPQIKLSRRERLANVKGVFKLAVKPALIHQKKILLIDDICTTGATLNECAQILKENNCRVLGMVIARGT